jgi:hypothetical protein
VAATAVGASWRRGKWWRGDDTERVVCKSIEKRYFPTHNLAATGVGRLLDEPARESREFHPKVVINELGVRIKPSEYE